MVSDTAVQGLRLAVAARGGELAGREDALVAAIRSRFNQRADSSGLPGRRAHVLHALAPLYTAA